MRLKGLVIIVILLSAYIPVTEMMPPGAVDPYFNGVFPASTPGAQGSWELENPLGDLEIPSPVNIKSFTNANDILVLSKRGEVYRISVNEQESELVLDIKDRVFRKSDGGSVGMALHPQFHTSGDSEKKALFILYKYKPDPEVWSDVGFNRLSKFYWDIDGQKFDPDSEEILIQQFDRSPWHDGGGMFFGPDGFLYIGVGDEGYEDFQTASTQRLDGGFFSGILRIDIDNDPSRSHPIRRQPRGNEAPPQGWGNTYSQGYSIPNSNPWISENGDHLEEFISIGIRNPYTMHYDEDRELIWLADVGSNKREEINLVGLGDNCQWPYMEGTTISEVHEKPEELIGKERPVYFEYSREVGSCIIGGGVYNGTRYPGLNGNYLFADYTQNKIMALVSTGTILEPDYEVLISNVNTQPVIVPEKAGITGLWVLEDGHIYATIMGEDSDIMGRILRLKPKQFVPDPPAKLSDLGIFKSLETLEPASGMIYFDVNSPLWSDGAIKKRWMIIPNDGDFDSMDEKVEFDDEEAWIFPAGSVFVKHFELSPETSRDGKVRHLETRIFVIAEGVEAYGLTYKWNDEGTDAILQGGGSSRDFDIYENGEYVYSQTWDYPGRDQCMTCHNNKASYILGVKTHQLNREIDYDSGFNANQLDYLDDLNVFNRKLDNPKTYIRSTDILDEDADLEWKIRSYLDANCASCHKAGVIPEVDLDFSLSRFRNLVEYYDFPTTSHASNEGSVIIKPGDHSQSELWVRDSSLEDKQMPPLARNVLDQSYIDSLAYWIDNINIDDIPVYHDVILFPNPTQGRVALRINDEWPAPYDIRIRTSTGHLLYQDEIVEWASTLDLSMYPAGTYFVSVRAGDFRKTEKVVVY